MKYLLFICIVSLQLFCAAQSLITLPDAIRLCQKKSTQATINKNILEMSYQTYRLQYSQLFPQINLSSNLPGYNSSITSVTQPDGTIRFTTVEQSFSSVGVNISQKIAATGGTINASSNINRFDRFSGSRTTNYNTQPFIFGLSQPLFRFNELAHQQRIAKANKLIGSKVFIKDQEQLALDVCNQYNVMLQMQQNISLLQGIKFKTDTLLQLANQRFALGKMSEEEYLQIELEQLNITLQLQQTKGNYELLKVKFCNLLNIPTRTELILVENEPNSKQPFSVDGDFTTLLLNQYKSNNPEYEQQKLKQLQNHAELQRGKYNRLPNINLIASYGSNQSASVFTDTYENLRTQQNATIGISVPLFSSGANIINLKIAGYEEHNLQLQTQLLEQQVMHDLIKQIQAYNLAIVQINNAQFADSIAQRRYEISSNKYRVGKLTYTDLLIAQNQKIQAKQAYIAAISSYWNAYYQLRAVTLYDIETQQTISITDN